MKKSIENLNNQGLVAYQLKCIVALINYFGYHLEEWREVLEVIADYTYFHRSFGKIKGRQIKSDRDWARDSCRYKPESVLTPCRQDDGKAYCYCPDCHHKLIQFAEYNADYGLCLNMESCEYVKNNPRYNGFGFNFDFEDVRRRCYKLYVDKDFRLLIALNNVLSIDSDISYEFFDGDRSVYLRDTLKIFDELNIPYPSLEDIHEYAFGEENDLKAFSSYELLIAKKEKSNE